MSTLLDKAASKASPRRFTDEPCTAMGELFPLPTDAGARMAEIWPDAEAEEIETPRSIAELSQDHHEQHKEMEADDDRAGFDPF